MQPTCPTPSPFHELFNPAFRSLSQDRKVLLEQQLLDGRLTMRAAVGLGYADVDSVEECVDFWHQRTVGATLQEFLGLDDTEYALWLRSADILTSLFNA